MQLTPQNKNKAQAPLSPAASPVQAGASGGAQGQGASGAAVAEAAVPEVSPRTAAQPDGNTRPYDPTGE